MHRYTACVYALAACLTLVETGGAPAGAVGSCAPALRSAVAETGLLSITHFGAAADDGLPDDEAVRQAINASLHQVTCASSCECGCSVHVSVATFSHHVPEIVTLTTLALTAAGMWWNRLFPTWCVGIQPDCLD